MERQLCTSNYVHIVVVIIIIIIIIVIIIGNNFGYGNGIKILSFKLRITLKWGGYI